MSFNLTKIKLDNKSKVQDDIKMCYGCICNDSRLSDNVKKALRKYLDFNIKNRGAKSIKLDKISNMLEELLVFCCNKEYNSISKQDVINNEKIIINEIIKAVQSGSTNSFIKNISDNVNILYTNVDQEEKEDITSYLEGLML